MIFRSSKTCGICAGPAFSGWDFVILEGGRAIVASQPDGSTKFAEVTLSAADRDTLVGHLDRCADSDYFERGIETAIAEGGMRVVAVDISGYGCVEVDFEPDLERANRLGSS